MRKFSFRRSRRLHQAPCWVLPLTMAVYCEILLHFWTMEQFQFHRLAAVTLFSLGLGGVLAFLCSLFPAKAGKWAGGIMSTILVIICWAELMMHDQYRVFMPPETIQAGAAGVVSDYMNLVLNQILTHLPHLLVMIAPMAAFCLLVGPRESDWGARGILAACGALLYVAAVSLVNLAGTDAARFTDAYNFDSAVRCFGLHTAFVLDAIQSSGAGSSDLEFEIPETQPTTEAPTTEPEPTPSTDPEDTQETTEATEPPVVYTEHTLGLDFAALAEAERDSDIAALHSYVASQSASMTNEYTGLFEGKNLIFITAEAFCGAFISEELTPTLYRLATEGIQFTDYYQPTWGASTTGGEYSNLVGLVPKGGSCMKEAYQQDFFLTIGNQLQKLGYSSAAFHNNSYTYYDRNKTHTCLGYDYFMGYGNGMEKGVVKNWPESDLEMMEYTVDLYIDEQPFSVYYMTVSGHCEYNDDNDMAVKNWSLVKDLDYSATVRYYIATQMELEAAMTSLLAQLEEAGILDDTVIVLAADHYPYGLDSSGNTYLKELMGVSQINDFTRDQNTLIIWSGCIEDMDIVVDTPVMSLDILPTLSNLFGVEYDSRLLVGRDVFSDAEPLVFWSISGSWKTDKGSYDASTKKFTPAEGVEVADGYVDYINALVSNKLKYSKAVAEHDYFNYVAEALEDLE